MVPLLLAAPRARNPRLQPRLAAAARYLPIVLLLLMGTAEASEPGFAERQMEAFRHSQFVFQRSDSNLPFPPLAFIDASRYADAEVDASDRGERVTYNVSSVSQAAGIPWLIGDRDALLVGEYLSQSEFHLEGTATDRFEVTTVGLPLGWIRQVDSRWQAAAFFMPMGHEASLNGSHWTWQYLGGVFGRYVQNDRLWWAVGAYVDIAPGDDFYIPYVGASWALTPQWTLSAVLPWPAILYSPSEDWLFRAGVSPSSASWAISPDTNDDAVALNLDAWDVGVSAERRITGGVFASVEAGVGGFRGLRLEGSDVKDPDITVSSSPYISIELKYRPE